MGTNLRTSSKQQTSTIKFLTSTSKNLDRIKRLRGVGLREMVCWRRIWRSLKLRRQKAWQSAPVLAEGDFIETLTKSLSGSSLQDETGKSTLQWTHEKNHSQAQAVQCSPKPATRQKIAKTSKLSEGNHLELAIRNEEHEMSEDLSKHAKTTKTRLQLQDYEGTHLICPRKSYASNLQNTEDRAQAKQGKIPW